MRATLIPLFLLIVLIACSAQDEATANLATTSTPTPVLMTATPTNTATPTALPPATPTPPPTLTTMPTATPTATLTPSPTPTASNTPTPTNTPEIDRSCPELFYPKYDRNWLAKDPWPTPVASPESHLWFSKPLPPGFGRLLINENFSYGWDGGTPGALHLHNGVDVSVELGTPVLAVADGTVVTARDDLTERFGWRCNWFGQLVVIKHDDLWQGEPLYSLYGHVININVEEGDRVSRHDKVAEVGFGGAATVRHLHFEVRVGQSDHFHTRNPLLWLQPAIGRSILVGRVIDPEGRPWQGVPVIAVPNPPQDGLVKKQAWTYLGDPENVAIPDEGYAENFVIGDLKPGSYILYTSIQGEEYNIPITIQPDEINTIEIVTKPYKAAD